MSAEKNPDSAPTRARKAWKAAILLAASGLLGGIAFAFWNRRELTEIQSRRDEPGDEEPAAELEEQIY